MEIEVTRNKFKPPDIGLVQEMQSDLIRNICQEIQDKKETVLIQALQKNGIDINVEEEAKRRFSRLACFVQENTQSWYWNDGSVGGLRIVTFIDTELDGDYQNPKFTMEIKYY